MGSAGRLRELRIQATNGVRGEQKRNLPLALVLSSHESDSWMKSVENCFWDKFNLSVETQRQHLDVDHLSYVTKEERLMSSSVPGIVSIYKSHNVVINVKDRFADGLACVGLPKCTDFTTVKADVEYRWGWATVGTMSKEDELMQLLQSSGVDMTEWSADSFSQLYTEVHDKQTATLERRDNVLMRTIRVIKIWVHANILNHEQVLVMKKKMQNGKNDDSSENKPVSKQMTGDHWESNMVEALSRLGMTEQLQEECLNVDMSSYKFSEEVTNSRSFPGLKTVYLINEVSVYVIDPTNPDLHFLGLPDGNDFSFVRMDRSATVVIADRQSKQGPSSNAGMTLFHWGWEPVSVRESIPKKRTVKTVKKADPVPVVVEKERPPKRRAPTPEALRPDSDDGPLLQRLMANQTTDWGRARNAAQRIRDPDYSCKHFFDDISAAFPELRLYVQSGSCSASGRSHDDEYQRTIAALFAVYWLMRVSVRGHECFCFGLNEDWTGPMKPMLELDDPSEEAAEFEKRQAFFEQADWETLTKLFKQAGLLTEDGHDPERTLAMLVLMAIHDIMKVTALLPAVEEAVVDFSGYKVGDVVSDHDVALSYILEHHPSWLPSFHGLPTSQRESVKFTHSKLDYNMGWLVQAEAPPGALFRTFKNVVVSGHARSHDIAFYFVHWFVDLAGAEPYPLEGCEKFVLKFPLKLLQMFLDSFSIVGTLSEDTTETQVFEKYIRWRWSSHEPSLGIVPVGAGSVALMRLVVMAQGDSRKIVKAFSQLSEEDREVLSTEMAITGLPGQQYSGESLGLSVGPAILVYYAPALMQKAGKQNPAAAMKVLAEVFRQTRQMWPIQEAESMCYVIVRIETLKEKDINALLKFDSSSMWVIQRASDHDGAVKQIPISSLGTVNWRLTVVLNFAGKSTSVTLKTIAPTPTLPGCRKSMKARSETSTLSNNHH